MKVLVLFGMVAFALSAKLGSNAVFDEEETPTEPPKPYNFGWAVMDKNTTNYQNRAEIGDEDGRVKGSYSYVLPDGFVYTVTYEDKKDGNGLVQTLRKEPSGIDVIIPAPKPKEPISKGIKRFL
ncbi:cuticle protein 19.8-like [Macrobrachium rosenbergii]|uniref:cuticle protein 19.8-like n=1 Tax=Macrobrachium rosenbergii TaxID=79674 RepID=UPI0034D57B74